MVTDAFELEEFLGGTTPEQAVTRVINAGRIVRALLPEEVVGTAILAGGYLRSQFDGSAAKDIDLFFTSWDHWNTAVEVMRASGGFIEVEEDKDTPHPSFKCLRDGSTTFNLIGFGFMATPKELADSFDFRCAAMAIRLSNPDLYIAKGAVQDCEWRSLNILNIANTDRLITRAAHYIKNYGYHATPEFCGLFPQSADAGPGEFGYT